MSESDNSRTPRIVREGRYQHTKFGEVQVTDIKQEIFAVDCDGELESRIRVSFNTNPIGDIWDGEEENIITRRLETFIDCLENESNE